MSEDFCEKVRASHPVGYFNHSAETKKQISNTLKTRYANGELIQHESKNKKRCLNLDTGEIFDSLAKAAKAYGITNPNSIRKCSEGKFKISGGYHWKLIN